MAATPGGITVSLIPRIVPERAGDVNGQACAVGRRDGSTILFMIHIADRLAAAVRAKGNAVCVGLDPRWESLPLAVRQRHGSASLTTVAAAYEEFCSRVLDIVAPLVPVVKPQSAFFEACGPEGMAALQRLLRRARDLGLITILDAKRNDIASTGAAYADAALAGVSIEGVNHPIWDADA